MRASTLVVVALIGLMLSSCATRPVVTDDDWGCDCSENDDIDLARYAKDRGCVWVIDQRGSISQICPAVLLPARGDL